MRRSRAPKPVDAHPDTEHRALKRLLVIVVAAATAAVVFSGDGLGGRAAPMTEVVVTLKAPPLSMFGRSLT